MSFSNPFVVMDRIIIVIFLSCQSGNYYFPNDSFLTTSQIWKHTKNLLKDAYAKALAKALNGTWPSSLGLSGNEGSIIERIPDRVPGMGNDGFYLIVSGDSMEPIFEQGDKLAVSRALPPRKGRYCVIEFIDSTAAVKRFVGRTDKELVCEQLNPKKTLKFNMNEVVNIYAVVGHVF